MRDRIRACLLGGMVGDAAGATLEFTPVNLITDKSVRKAMCMPGGGRLNVAPGQVTDDSELMFALACALAGNRTDKDEFPLDAVANEYVEWFQSMPFDCGSTCGRAFAFVKDARQMMENAARYNYLSEANGALMRCAPIACWSAAKGLSSEDTAEAAMADARLSHPNAVCQVTNAVFCASLRHLLLASEVVEGGESTGRVASVSRHVSVGAAEGALDVARSMLARWSENDGAEPGTIEKKAAAQKVGEWFRQAESIGSHGTRGMRAYRKESIINPGHVKHAFVLAFALLVAFSRRGASDVRSGSTESGIYPSLSSSFESGLFEVLMHGGDTDTNACICGYVMGALYGLEGETSLPDEDMHRPIMSFRAMADRVLAFDCEMMHAPSAAVTETGGEKGGMLLGHRRPRAYKNANVLHLSDALASYLP